MGESLELLRLTRIEYEDGSVIWVETKPEMAEFLRRLDEREKKREQRRKAREKTFSEMGIDDRAIGGNPWEGPRYGFTWLIGESRTWNGDPMFELEGEVYCSFCLGSKLPSWSYCLGCDRSGKDSLIQPAYDPERKARARRNDGLKGGLDGKR